MPVRSLPAVQWMRAAILGLGVESVLDGEGEGGDREARYRRMERKAGPPLVRMSW